jgi:hypothetical protein
MLGLALMVIGILLGLGEFYVWHSGLLWHDGTKRDPRNFPPSQ